MENITRITFFGTKDTREIETRIYTNYSIPEGKIKSIYADNPLVLQFLQRTKKIKRVPCLVVSEDGEHQIFYNQNIFEILNKLEVSSRSGYPTGPDRYEDLPSLEDIDRAKKNKKKSGNTKRKVVETPVEEIPIEESTVEPVEEIKDPRKLNLDYKPLDTTGKTQNQIIEEMRKQREQQLGTTE